MEHNRWTPNGRRLVIPETGQQIYTSRIGQANFHVTGSTYASYDWNSASSIVRFADCELRIIPSTGPELWRGGVMLSRIVPKLEAFVGGFWTDMPLVFTRLQIVEQDLLGASAEWRGTLIYDHAIAQVQFELQVGASHKLHMAHRLRAKVPGRYRATTEIPVASRASVQTRRLPGGRAAVSTHYMLPGGLLWRMAPSETAQIGVDNDTALFRERMLEGDYTTDQERERRPETLGPVGIGNDDDDGDETRNAVTWNNQGNYGVNLYLENSNSASTIGWVGLGWRAIDLNTAAPGVSSIDAGTQIDVVNPGDNSTPTAIDATLSGVNAGGGAVWSATNRPSQQVSTAATVTLVGSAGNQTWDVQGIVSEWVITELTAYEGAAGDDMYFYAASVNESLSNWWSVTADYDGAGAGVEATLTIVYTATGGGPTTRNTRSNPLGQELGMGLRIQH